MTTKCPICSSSTQLWGKKISFETEYRIERCKSCDFAFVFPRPDIDFLRRFYSDPDRNESTRLSASEILRKETECPNSTIDARRLVSTLRRLLGGYQCNPCSSLLDIACGYGFFSKEAIAQGFNVTSLELEPNSAKIAREISGNPVTCQAFEEFDWTGSRFDAVIMSQILEHVTDVDQWLNKTCHLLRKGGILAIAVPNFGGISRITLQIKDPLVCPPQHINFFSRRNLTLLLEKHGFSIKRIQWTTRLPTKTTLEFLGFRRMIPIYNKVRYLPMIGLLDTFHCGMYMSVYGQKDGP